MRTNERSEMTTLELRDRERSGGRTEWIVGRSPYFISHRDDGDEVWRSNRPYGVNDRIFKFPANYTPTLEDIDEVIYYNGNLPDDADNIFLT
jgi:hypothetical protein